MTRRNLLKTLFGAILAGRMALECGAKKPKLNQDSLTVTLGEWCGGAIGADGAQGDPGSVDLNQEETRFAINPNWLDGKYEVRRFFLKESGELESRWIHEA